MDTTNDAVARESADRQLPCRLSEEAGGIQDVSAQAQTAARRTESQAGDEFQHSADEAEAEQQTGVHAHRGKNGVRYK